MGVSPSPKRTNRMSATGSKYTLGRFEKDVWGVWVTNANVLTVDGPMG